MLSTYPTGRLAALTLIVALATGVSLLAAADRGIADAGHTITSPDSGGQYTSITLDVSGFPVISHYYPASGDLKVVHCGDATCSSGNTLASPDTTFNVGQYSSLELDASGDPVVSYFDVDYRDLKVLRCGNPACTSGNTIRTPDASLSDSTGLYSSLELNASDNAMISYLTVPFDGLKVIRCSDAPCDFYSPNYADSGKVGYYSSLALDANGFPVVSYYDLPDGDLRVVHCGNATCTFGNTIVWPDSAGDVGQHTSIALDSSGFPVVSYYAQGDLKVLHCGDATCSSGNSIRSPDTGAGGDVGKYTSLRLDANGFPVVSYYSVTGGDLRVLHCGDANCASGNTIRTVDSTGDVGQYSSLVLDASGFPVISYRDATNGMLKVLHCGDATCSPKPPTPPPPTVPPTPVPVGGFTELPDVSRPGSGGSMAWIVGGLAATVLAGGALVWRRRIRSR